MKRINSKTPQYNTVLFTEVWDDVDEFLEDYQHVGEDGIPVTISTTNATTLFYLLYARYGNNPIANFDINQFKFKIFSIIFQYGPVWEKKLDIQTKVRGLTDADLLTGSKAIYNQALNPGTTPSTTTTEELTYINAQNTSNIKRGKLEAYELQWSMLDDTLTNNFLDKFSICFKKFVSPENPLLYITEETEDEEDEG